MPITSENFQRAIQALAKAKSDPNADPARIAKIQANVDEYLASSGQYGPDAPPVSEISANNAADPTFKGRGSVAGYFYNPSVQELRSALKDRAVRERLGLGDNYQTGESVGADYLKSQVPELSGLNKTNIDELTEQSPEYKKYAEYAYQQALGKDPSIKRYDDLDIMQNPGQAALGAIIKYGPAAAIGAEKNAGLGAFSGAFAEAMKNTPAEPGSRAASVGAPRQSAEQSAADERVKQGINQTKNTLESLSPGASMLGGMASYALPFAPSNIAQRELADVANYAGRGVIGKALTSGAIGGTVGASEGAIQDITQNPNISGQQLLQNAIPRAMGGAAFGAGGDLLAQAAARGQQVIRESPRYDELKNLEDVGGGTNLWTGVSAPEAVRENITLATKPREARKATDIAAQKVAPNVLESNTANVQAARKKAGDELENYLNRPEIAAQQESMQPVADNIFDMFNKGTFEGAVSGDLKHPNAAAAKTFKDVLHNIGEVAYVSPEEAANFASANRGRVIDQKQMAALGIKPQEGKVPVYVASKMNARALLEMEQMIDDRLKMATVEGGANNPVWKDINRSVKQVRDRFGNPNRAPSTPPATETNQSVYPPDEPLPNYSVSPVEPNQSIATSPTGIQEDITNVPTDIRFEQQNPLSPKISTTDGGQISIHPDVNNPIKAELNRLKDRRANTEYHLKNGFSQEEAKQNAAFYQNKNQSFFDRDAQRLNEVAGKNSSFYERNPNFDPNNPDIKDMGSQAGYSSISPEELSFSSVNPPDMTDSEWARFNEPKAKTEYTNPNALPAYSPQAAGREISREPGPLEYRSGDYGQGPNENWENRLPEANQYLNENDYGEYLRATRSDSARQNNFAQSMEGQYWKRPAEMSEKELDKEVIAILKGEGIDMNITPENRARVYDALETKGEQFAPYIARLKEIQAKQLAKQQAAKTGIPGEPAQSSYEELGSSALEPDRSSLATSKTEYAQPSIGQRSAEAAYTPSEMVPNQGTFTPSEVARDINEAGGVGAAGKLNRGMREESLQRESAKYAGKTPEEVNQIAENLEYPIDISIDNGNVMLRDGRHRLEAAKRAGAKNIRVRVRKFNSNGKAEEVTTQSLPIDAVDSISSAPAAKESVSPTTGESVANPSPDVSQPIPTETLDDGTVVYGLSAMQRKHHKELERLNKIEELTGTTQESAHRKVLGYKLGEGHPYNDQALAEQADNLGLRQQLEEVAATRDFPQLRARAWYGGDGGLINSTKDFAVLHFDPILGAIAGQPPNPFTAPPNTPAGRIQQYLFRQGVPFRPLLEGRAGLAGARFGNKVFNKKDEENK